MKKTNKNKTSGDWYDTHVIVEGLSPEDNKKIKKLLRDELPKKFRNVNEGWNDGNPMNG
jgi:uncharacterized protein YajQ (UPF0234 family)